jgi:hypothetical protein
MPITSDGKSPDLSPFREDIGYALEKATRKARREAGGWADEAGKTTAKRLILDHIQAAAEKCSGPDHAPFSLRQLYYVQREFIERELNKELKYDHFGKVIAEYEREQGPIPGLYRDPRGVLYHPHTGEEIQLGTRQVAEYERPSLTFRNVLYCEKEGFFPILKAAAFPERYDCALLTSKGFASGCCRDLIDMLAETDEEVTFFCIHDADAAGSMIYQALQEATRARPARKIRIINLGLDPDEARALELQVERVQRKAGRKLPVADYLSREAREWLQSHRVELNAMITPQFIAWLERKMAEHGVRKVIPPADVMEEHLESEVRRRLEQKITDDVLRDARIDEKVEQRYQACFPRLQARRATLPADVESSLQDNARQHWTNPIDTIAKAITRDEPETA